MRRNLTFSAESLKEIGRLRLGLSFSREPISDSLGTRRVGLAVETPAIKCLPERSTIYVTCQLS